MLGLTQILNRVNKDKKGDPLEKGSLFFGQFFERKILYINMKALSSYLNFRPD